MSYNKLFRDTDKESIIQYICNHEYSFFLNKQNIVGIGCGYKVKNAFRTKQLCIQVFVKNKLPKYRLLSHDMVPLTFKGILTDVIEVGEFTPCSLIKKIRPVKGGYAIGPEGSQRSGTTGCLVSNGVSYFILGTNHVLTNTESIGVGRPILQPSSKYRGVYPRDMIGNLDKYIPLRFATEQEQPINLVDCALGILYDPSIVSPEIALIGTLNSVKSPALNSTVKKVGSITELTTGTVLTLHVTTLVNYHNNKSCLFNELIYTTKMSKLGDSGAILVNKHNSPVGMLIGQTTNISAFCRMDLVLDALDVNLVTSL